MRQRKLFTLLTLLEPEDIPSFQAFLDSVYFNNSPTLLRFFNLWVEKLLLRPEAPDPTVEDFLEGTGIQPYRMDKLCSQLSRMTLQFLAQREYDNQESMKNERLLAAIGRKNQASPELERQYKRIMKRVQRSPLSTERSLQRLQLRWLYAESMVRTRETQSLWKEDLNDLHDLLDDYYLLQKLKLVSASANLRLIYNQDSEDPAKLFWDRLKGSGQAKMLSPLAKAYYWIVEMIKGADDETAYQELTALLKKTSHSFEPDEAKELYGYAINFCIRKQNEGLHTYRVRSAELYRELLEKGLLLDNGQLVPAQMKNLVSIHCNLGELEWVEQFIEEYRDKLPEEAMECAIIYNEAVLAFFQGDFGKAIPKFKEVIRLGKEDVFYELDARAYIWKSYFEHLDHLSIEEVDEMYRLYDAFRIYIDRNERISSTHKQRYRNFIREFKRFMVILEKDPPDRDELSELKKTVESIPLMASKAWFLKKLDAAMES